MSGRDNISGLIQQQSPALPKRGYTVYNTYAVLRSGSGRVHPKKQAENEKPAVAEMHAAPHEFRPPRSGGLPLALGVDHSNLIMASQSAL